MPSASVKKSFAQAAAGNGDDSANPWQTVKGKKINRPTFRGTSNKIVKIGMKNSNGVTTQLLADLRKEEGMTLVHSVENVVRNTLNGTTLLQKKPISCETVAQTLGGDKSTVIKAPNVSFVKFMNVPLVDRDGSEINIEEYIECIRKDPKWQDIKFFKTPYFATPLKNPNTITAPIKIGIIDDDKGTQATKVVGKMVNLRGNVKMCMKWIVKESVEQCTTCLCWSSSVPPTNKQREKKKMIALSGVQIAMGNTRQHPTSALSSIFEVNENQSTASQTEFYDDALKNMASANKTWEAVQWTRARKPPPAMVKNREGNPVASLEELWDVFHHQYNQSTEGAVDDSIVYDIPSRTERDSFPISRTELLDALTSCSNVSAPGPDKLTWYHLKHLMNEDRFCTDIVNLYNDILNLGVWPSPFKESYSVVIPKPNKPHYESAKMYRPITLLNTLGKLFTKTLAKRTNQECITHSLLFKGQCGGVEEHSTLDAGITLLAFIQDAQRKGLFPSFLTFYIAQFFPSINHDLLCQILQHLGFSLKIVNFFRSFFQNRHTMYAWGSFKSPLFSCSHGVPQGDCLSPILTAIFISVLFHIIETRFGTTNKLLISFVDDGGIAVASESIFGNCRALEEIMTFVIDTTHRLGLQIEGDKTELIHFRTLLFNKWHGPVSRSITVNNKEIKNKDVLRVYYPPLLNMKLKRPEGAKGCKPILAEHDMFMIGCLKSKVDKKAIQVLSTALEEIRLDS
ncbi:hypothetical protein AX17_004695 [Amanita inopinata Kibby_2008]|nr:hypothetical protein AX17_004695 [Amanita inopinata Kibby_2008]